MQNRVEFLLQGNLKFRIRAENVQKMRRTKQNANSLGISTTQLTTFGSKEKSTVSNSIWNVIKKKEEKRVATQFKPAAVFYEVPVVFWIRQPRPRGEDRAMETQFRPCRCWRTFGRTSLQYDHVEPTKWNDHNNGSDGILYFVFDDQPSFIHYSTCYAYHMIWYVVCGDLIFTTGFLRSTITFSKFFLTVI